jgi:hypothetical protein
MLYGTIVRKFSGNSGGSASVAVVYPREIELAMQVVIVLSSQIRGVGSKCDSTHGCTDRFAK